MLIFTESDCVDGDYSDAFCADESEKYSKAVIDDLLREEFGVGLHLGPEEEKLVQKQRSREGRGLHRLSSELYSRDTHFVLELVQNADDNSYPDDLCGKGSEGDGYDLQPAVVFVVTKSCVTVLNNESGFQEGHIRALCDVGRSTKGKHMKGYIGNSDPRFPNLHGYTLYFRYVQVRRVLDSSRCSALLTYQRCTPVVFTSSLTQTAGHSDISCPIGFRQKIDTTMIQNLKVLKGQTTTCKCSYISVCLSEQ